MLKGIIEEKYVKINLTNSKWSEMMKKWIILFIVLLVFAAGFGYHVYSQILYNKTAGHEEAIEIATEEANLIEVLETSTYARNEVYFVVKGIDEEDTTVFVFVPEAEGQVVIVDAADGLTEEEALELLKERQSFTRILSVQLGLEGGSPTWEITYINDEDRLTYYYLDFHTGEFIGIRVL